MNPSPPQELIEQQRLFHLNHLAEQRRFIDDGKCLYCGIRARVRNLCVPCEDRRQRLAEKYPGVTPLAHVQEKITSGFTKLGDVKRPTVRQPHNSE